MTTSTLKLSGQLLVGEMVKRASHRAPNELAFVYEDQKVTFKEFDEKVTHLAGWLQENGIKKEDKVGLILKNSLAFPEVIFGTALSGGVAVPINFRLGPSELEYIIDHSDTKILIIDDEQEEIIQSILDRLPKVEKVVVVGNKTEERFISYSSVFEESASYTPCEDLMDNDPFCIAYTSGTTGRPKGAVLTHKNIAQNAMNHVYETNGYFGERQLISVPQFHIAGLLLTVKTFLTNGMTVIQRDFVPQKVLEALVEHKINAIFLVPAMWNFLMQIPDIDKYDFSHLRTINTGAAITPLELKKRLLKTFKNATLNDNFGQTETTATGVLLSGEDSLRKPDSIGKPIVNVEIRVVDENMNDVPVGEVGEIVYRGPTVMKEYYKNPEATKEAFEGGWFHSGDLVKVDEEGFIYVVDRKKDMIISGGENIYPAEVEEVIYQMPEVLEVAVIGVPHEKWGETVKAVVVLKPGETLTEQEVIDYCSRQIASYKKPTIVEFVDELPRNASGKVLKYVLKEQAMKQETK